MTMSLFNISQEHRALHDYLMESQDDLQAIADTLNGESMLFEEKAKRVAYVIKTLEAESVAMNNTALEISKRANSKSKKAESLSEYLKSCMEIAVIQKVSCAEFDIAIKNSPPSVLITDEKLIPSAFWVQPPMPEKRLDKKAIATVIKGGDLVAGAELVRETRIEIR